MTVLVDQPATVSSVSPSDRAPRGAGRSGRVDALLVAVLALLALVIRWPYLWTAPRFTDETLEVLHSLAIVRDGARPLTNYDSYYGALYNYVVALALLLSNESALAPRVVVLLAGVATVAATYLLGAEIGARLLTGGPRGAASISPRLVGLLAAALLATNGPHVVVNSHVAWSNCLTPLLTTLAFWAVLRWGREDLTPQPPLRRGEGGLDATHQGEVSVGAMNRAPTVPANVGARFIAPASNAPASDTSASPVAPRAGARGGRVRFLLPLAGLLLGLALQTHPLVVALLPGVALAVLLRDWRVLRTPWPWLALVALLVGYANVLVYNAAQGFDSLTSALRMTEEYGRDQQSSSGYSATFGSMLLLLGRVLGGAVDQRDSAVAYLADPAVVAIGVLAVAGLGLLAVRRELLPLLVTLGFLLILPAANPKFQTLLTTRYLMPIVPLLFACACLTLVWLAEAARARWPATERRPLLAVLMVGLMLAAIPLVSLDRYYQRLFELSDTNERIHRLVAEIAAARQPDELVLVDDSIGGELPDTGVTELRGLEYLLTFGRVPHQRVRPSPGRLQDSLDGQRSVLAILNARDASAAAGRLGVESLDPRPPVETGRMFDFRLYRLRRDRA